MINDRIRELITYFTEGNKRRFSQLTNLSPSVVENLVGSRQGKPSFDVLEKIVFAFADINTDWLITGRGEMLQKNARVDVQADGQIAEKYTPNYTPIYTPIYTPKENSKEDRKVGETHTHLQIQPSKPSPFAVPFYDIPMSAGPLGVLTYGRDAVKPDGYIDMEVFRRCEVILPVMGVSMEPEIRSGDLIGIRKLDCYSWDYVETGKVYIIVTHYDRVIKYINKADDVDYIVCSSPNYSDFKVRKCDVLEVYRVVANIHAF